MEAETKTKKGSWVKTLVIFILVIFVVVIGGTITYGYHILNTNKFYGGVEIEGISLKAMTKEGALKAIKEHYQPNLDKMKIVLAHGDREWKFDYKDINAQINAEEIIDEAFMVGRVGTIFQRLREIYKTSNKHRKFGLSLTHDVSLLQDKIRGIAEEINGKPMDATIEFHPDKENKFTCTPEKTGIIMLQEKTISDLGERIEAGDFSPYVIPTEESYPQYALDEVKTWTSRIGYYSTPLDNKENRNHNIRLSSKAFYNYRVNPGEVFSLNEATGPRGIENGYKLASAIMGGKKFVDAPGGGNCQTSTTLYGAAMRADLKIIERAPHSIKSTYTPIGTDAMVGYPYADFKFENDKDTPIFLTSYISGGRLHVEIYGKQSGEYDKIEVISWETENTGVPAYEIVEDPSLPEGKVVIEYKSRAGSKAVSYKVYYKDGKEIKRVKAANSSYRRVVGLKRVGTKKAAD